MSGRIRGGTVQQCSAARVPGQRYADTLTICVRFDGTSPRRKALYPRYPGRSQHAHSTIGDDCSDYRATTTNTNTTIITDAITFVPLLNFEI